MACKRIAPGGVLFDLKAGNLPARGEKHRILLLWMRRRAFCVTSQAAVKSVQDQLQLASVFTEISGSSDGPNGNCSLSASSIGNRALNGIAQRIPAESTTAQPTTEMDSLNPRGKI